MTITDAPKAMIRRAEKLWPGCFAALERIITDVQVPLKELAAELLAGRYGLEVQVAALEAPILAAAFLWMKAPNIYRFFGAFSDSLGDYCDTVSAGDVLPVEAVTQLHYRCVYLYAPGVFSCKADGCLCYLDSDGLIDTLEVVFPFSEKAFFSASVRLHPQKEILECLPAMESMVESALFPAWNGHPGAMAFLVGGASVPTPFDCPVHNSLLRIIQHCLYLISMNADVQSAEGESEQEIRFYDVGFQMTPPEPSGEPQQPKSDGDGTGGPKRAHLRRAHWHNYWVRNEAGEKVLTPKWIAAVYVGAREDD